MEFMEKLQKQKDDAKAAYIKARDEWAETRTAPAAFLFILVDAKQMHCALTFWMYCAYNDL